MLQNSYSKTPTGGDETLPKKENPLCRSDIWGGSLAIHMNSMVQELYKMVRAFLPWRADGSFGPYRIENPEGTEVVYQVLGKSLRARFVIDIDSGTSAGGINSVSLAKELVKNLPMRQLQDLWSNRCAVL